MSNIELCPIQSIIRNIQDIMRQDAGLDSDAQRISQIVWMVFLKMFDNKEKKYETLDPKYKSPISERLRWRNWAAKAIVIHSYAKVLKRSAPTELA